MAELLGREGGYNQGKGGSYHTCIPALGIPHTTAIVGGLVPIAVGVELTHTISSRAGEFGRGQKHTID